MEEHKPKSRAKAIGASIFITVVVLVGIGIWWNNTHYSAAYDNNFLSSCESGGQVSADTCGCALGVIKANYSYKEAKSFDTYLPTDVGNKVAAQCGS